MKNVWRELHESLDRPLLIQAPMEDATDTVFRQMIAKCGRPDLFYTEFTNVDGMASKYGHDKVTRRLRYDSSIETPIIAQIWGSKPENYYNAARDIIERGFDGIDINMGCPQKKVVKKGLCAAMIDDHERAGAVIQATIDGAASLGEEKRIPVTVKTRIGVRKIDTDNWVRFLLEFDLAALIIHGRTVREMSKVPAHWDEIGKAVAIRDEIEANKPRSERTLIIGNGDVKSRAEAIQKAEKFGVDGVMIARGIFDDIGVFNELPVEERTLTYDERLNLLEEHLNLWNETWGVESENEKSFNVIKKYVKVYIKDLPEASDMRERLMHTKTIANMLETIKELRKGSE